MTPEGNVQITKRLINNKTKEKFKNALQEMTWDDVISSKQTDSAYEAFLKGILKSSKTKQRLYDKFLKSKTYEHEISYKNYRKLFESIKQRAKSQYYSKMILYYKDNMKKLGKL